MDRHQQARAVAVPEDLLLSVSRTGPAVGCDVATRLDGAGLGSTCISGTTGPPLATRFAPRFGRLQPLIGRPLTNFAVVIPALLISKITAPAVTIAGRHAADIHDTFISLRPHHGKAASCGQ